MRDEARSRKMSDLFAPDLKKETVRTVGGFKFRVYGVTSGSYFSCVEMLSNFAFRVTPSR